MTDHDAPDRDTPDRDAPDRYAKAFAAARERGETLFMPYITAGFPTRAESPALIHALIDGGAGAIELGVPFSDPLADGPTIQRANTAALADGTDLPFILDLVRQLRADGVEVAITLMGYLNPLLAYGRAHGAGGLEPPAGGLEPPAGDAGDVGDLEPIARDAAAAGVDGFIIVDLPPEESDDALATFRLHGLALVYLLAPTSTEQRIAAVAQRASGFVYLISVTGVTGARAELPTDLVEFVQRARRAISLPLAVGFGVSNRKQVETVGQLCEAAVIGSAVITTVAEAAPEDRVRALRSFAELVSGRGREDTGE